MEIRPARPEDVPGLVDLWIEFMDFHSALDQDYVRSPDAVDQGGPPAVCRRGGMVAVRGGVSNPDKRG
jgi:hypothetical protein